MDISTKVELGALSVVGGDSLPGARGRRLFSGPFLTSSEHSLGPRPLEQGGLGAVLVTHTQDSPEPETAMLTGQRGPKGNGTLPPTQPGQVSGATAWPGVGQPTVVPEEESCQVVTAPQRGT